MLDVGKMDELDICIFVLFGCHNIFIQHVVVQFFIVV